MLMMLAAAKALRMLFGRRPPAAVAIAAGKRGPASTG